MIRKLNLIIESFKLETKDTEMTFNPYTRIVNILWKKTKTNTEEKLTGFKSDILYQICKDISNDGHTSVDRLAMEFYGDTDEYAKRNIYQVIHKLKAKLGEFLKQENRAYVLND